MIILLIVLMANLLWLGIAKVLIMISAMDSGLSPLLIYNPKITGEVGMAWLSYGLWAFNVVFITLGIVHILKS